MANNEQCNVWFYALMLGAAILTSSCAEQSHEATAAVKEPVAFNLDNTPLYPPIESLETTQRKDSLLRVSQTRYHQDSSDLNNIIWYGRRLAYLSRYPEAIEVYTHGLKTFPDSPELFRHRGHRYISIRKFDDAVADLTQAAQLIKGQPVEIEPDGIPNSINTPLSSLQFNIWYHLGLAHYLKGDYDSAAVAYDSCMRYSTNPDLLCATTDWYYMTLMRSGKTKEATTLLDAITPGMEVIENDGYLQRLLMYKGLLNPDSLIRFDEITEETELNVVTQGYGVAFYLSVQGNEARAKEVRERILNTSYWSAFGYIAAEADKFRQK